MQQHFAKYREQMQAQAADRMDQHVDALHLNKDKAILIAREHHSVELKESEKHRLMKKYESRLQQERQQMDILHNLEVTRVKAEAEGRLGIAKQKMLMDGGSARGETSEECTRLRTEVEALREQCESRVEEARDKREDELKGIMKALKADYQAKLEKEETRIQRQYQQKAQEECFMLRQRQEEALDRMQGTKREMRDKVLSVRMQSEKSKAD